MLMQVLAPARHAPSHVRTNVVLSALSSDGACNPGLILGDPGPSWAILIQAGKGLRRSLLQDTHVKSLPFLVA